MKLSSRRLVAFTFLVVPFMLCPQQANGIDLPAARGDYTADVTVFYRDGSVAAGEPYRIQLDVPGRDPDIVTGVIPDDGVIHMEAYAGGDNGPSYLLLVGKRRLEAARFTLPGEDRYRTLEFMVAPASGDIAPDIAFQDMNTGEIKKLSDFRGQIVYLDFWASWCGPCQKPMASSDEMVRRHKNDWEGKVAVVAISMDETIAAAKDHIRNVGGTP